MKNKLFYLTIICLLVKGCTEPLNQNAGKIELSVNWGDDYPEDSKPANFTLNLYDLSNVDAITRTVFDSCGRSTNFVSNEALPEGEYKLVAYNSDYTHIQIRNIENYGEVEAVLTVIGDTTNATSATFNQPNSFMGVHTEDPDASIKIKAGGSENVVLKPKHYLKSVVVNVTLENDHTLLDHADITLEGVANGVNLLTGVPFSDTGKRNRVTAQGVSPDKFSTTFNVFGLADGVANRSVILVTFKDENADGTMRTQTVDWDITDKIAGLNEMEWPAAKEVTVTLTVSKDSEAKAHVTLTDWDVITVGDLTIDLDNQ